MNACNGDDLRRAGSFNGLLADHRSRIADLVKRPKKAARGVIRSKKKANQVARTRQQLEGQINLGEEGSSFSPGGEHQEEHEGLVRGKGPVHKEDGAN